MAVAGDRVPTSAEQRDWEEIAAQDARWAILSAPERKRGGWDTAAFLRTGEDEVEGLMAHAASLGRPTGRDAALDFGCGIGRLTRPLAERFATAVGVDISERMVTEARELHGPVPGLAFEVNASPDLARFADASFDLVYTRIVLQHLPSREAVEGYVAEFVRILRPGGLLVFQVPAAVPLAVRAQPRRRAYQLLRRLGLPPRLLYWRLGLHPMRMQAMPTSAVLELVERLGARRLDVDTRRDPEYGFSDATYWVTKD